MTAIRRPLSPLSRLVRSEASGALRGPTLVALVAIAALAAHGCSEELGELGGGGAPALPGGLDDVPRATLQDIAATLADSSSTADGTVGDVDPTADGADGDTVVDVDTGPPNLPPIITRFETDAVDNAIDPAAEASIFVEAEDPEGGVVSISVTVEDNAWTIRDDAGQLVLVPVPVGGNQTTLRARATDDAGNTTTQPLIVSTTGGTLCGVGVAHCDGDEGGTCRAVNSGAGPFCPARSCLQAGFSVPPAERVDGRYWVKPAGVADAVEVRCGFAADGGGWTLIEAFDAAATPDVCPGDMVEEDGPEVCSRGGASDGTDHGVLYPAPYAFAELQGWVTGFRRGAPEAFEPDAANTLDSEYVEGLSITVGSPREHVWTYAVSRDPSGDPLHACPCRGGEAPDAFVGPHYTCQRGSLTDPGDNVWDSLKLFFGGGVGVDCDAHDSPSWYYRSFDDLEPRDVEARILMSTDAANEDFGVEELVIAAREAERCNDVDDDFDGLVDEIGACAQKPAESCLQIKRNGGWTGDGAYWIAPSGGVPFQAWCDMSFVGGGWTLAAVCRGWDAGCRTAPAVGTLTSPAVARTAKLSDVDISALLRNGNQTTRGLFVQEDDVGGRTMWAVTNVLGDVSAHGSTRDCSGAENVPLYVGVRSTNLGTYADRLAAMEGATTDALSQGAQFLKTTQDGACGCPANGWLNSEGDGCSGARWFDPGVNGARAGSGTPFGDQPASVWLWVR